MVARKGGYVVYIKEGEGIVDVLNVMEAHVSLMEMENVRILKGMSNYYNRQVNCETANIKKTVATSVRQIDDIDFIIQNKGKIICRRNYKISHGLEKRILMHLCRSWEKC